MVTLYRLLGHKTCKKIFGRIFFQVLSEAKFFYIKNLRTFFFWSNFFFENLWNVLLVRGGGCAAPPRDGRRGRAAPAPSRQGHYTTPYGGLHPPYGVAGSARLPPGRSEGAGFTRQKACGLRQAPSRQGPGPSNIKGFFYEKKLPKKSIKKIY